MGALHARLKRELTSRSSNAAGASLRNTAYMRFGKPLLDRLLAMTLLVLAAIPMGATAFLVRLRLGRPVFFVQPRIGKDGRPFMVLKFRTMSPERRLSQLPFDGPDRRKSHKRPDDPRIDKLGAVLRKWSLDETPQFWNVVRGDMSLVGPRPELPEIVARYEPWQHKRHEVKPGITGLWQISDRMRLMHEATEIDLEYVDNMSLANDLKILLRTPISVLGKGKGF